MKFICAHCRKEADRSSGEVNRARKAGNRLFCDRRCSGLGRRKPHKSKAQRRLEKKLYDQEYRRQNLAVIKAKKRAWFKANYNPEKARIERKAKMAQHVEYCRRPEYRRWKSAYDKRHRAKKWYGPFAEVAMLTTDLNKAIKERMTNHEIKWQNDTANKAQFRKREAKEASRSRPRHRNRRRDHSAAHG